MASLFYFIFRLRTYQRLNPILGIHQQSINLTDGVEGQKCATTSRSQRSRRKSRPYNFLCRFRSCAVGSKTRTSGAGRCLRGTSLTRRVPVSEESSTTATVSTRPLSTCTRATVRPDTHHGWWRASTPPTPQLG